MKEVIHKIFSIQINTDKGIVTIIPEERDISLEINQCIRSLNPFETISAWNEFKIEGPYKEILIVK